MILRELWVRLHDTARTVSQTAWYCANCLSVDCLILRGLWVRLLDTARTVSQTAWYCADCESDCLILHGLWVRLLDTARTVCQTALVSRKLFEIISNDISFVFPSPFLLLSICESFSSLPIVNPCLPCLFVNPPLSCLLWILLFPAHLWVKFGI